MHNEVDDDDDDLLDEPLIEINPVNKSSNHMCVGYATCFSFFFE